MKRVQEGRTRRERVVGDSVSYGFAAVVAKALALLTVPYLTRALSPEGYGQADLATSTAALVTLLAMFGGDIPAARSVGLSSGTRERGVVLSSFVYGTAATSVAIAGILLLASPLIAGVFWGNGDLAGLAGLSMLLVPISAVQAALAQTLRIDGRAQAFAGVSLVDLLAQLGAAVLLVSLGMGPAGVVMGFILGSILGAVVTGAAARQTLTVAPSRAIAMDVILRGIPFLPSVTMFVVADWAMRALAANFVGVVGVAEFAVALRVASVLSLLGAAFAMAWGPIGLAKDQGPDTAQELARVLVAFATISVATAFALAVVGPELVSIVGGHGFEGAALILPGLAIAYAIAGTEYVLVVAAGISERAWRVAAASTCGAAAQVLVAIALVPQYGTLAIGPTVVLGRAVSFLLLWLGVRRSVAIGFGWVLFGVAVVIAGFAALQAVLDIGAASNLGRWLLAAALLLLVATGSTIRLRAGGRADVA